MHRGEQKAFTGFGETEGGGDAFEGVGIYLLDVSPANISLLD
jgi:hypothetical protein